MLSSETTIKIEAAASALVQMATNDKLLLPARQEKKHTRICCTEWGGERAELPRAGNSGRASAVLQADDTRGRMQPL